MAPFEGSVQDGMLKLRLMLTAENTPLQHVIARVVKEACIDSMVDEGTLRFGL